MQQISSSVCRVSLNSLRGYGQSHDDEQLSDQTDCVLIPYEPPLNPRRCSCQNCIDDLCDAGCGTPL